MLISEARPARSLRERPLLGPLCNRSALAPILGHIHPAGLVVLHLPAGRISAINPFAMSLAHTSSGGPSYGHGNPRPRMSLPQVPRMAQWPPTSLLMAISRANNNPAEIEYRRVNVDSEHIQGVGVYLVELTGGMKLLGSGTRHSSL